MTFVRTKQMTYQIRYTEQERASWEARAASEGVTLAEWIRARLNDAPAASEAPKPSKRESVEVGGPSAKAIAWVKGLTDAEAKEQWQEVKRHFPWYEPTRMKPFAYDPHAPLTPEHLKFIFRT